jgi:hypothetical protein
VIQIPLIENHTAKELCNLFQESELLDAIAYIELVFRQEVIPGCELFRLGIDLNYSTQELWAVQNRLALAVHHMNTSNHPGCRAA